MAIRLAVVLSFLVVASSVLGDHDTGCVIESADPSTYNTVSIPLVGVYYVEERGVPPPFDAGPPIPTSGTLLGDGTWYYREINSVPGLQRGGCGGTLSGFQFEVRDVPAMCLPPPDPFGIIGGAVDPIYDENCGHGPDDIW